MVQSPSRPTTDHRRMLASFLEMTNGTRFG
jgi:hypothetical protein